MIDTHSFIFPTEFFTIGKLQNQIRYFTKDEKNVRNRYRYMNMIQYIQL